MTLSRVFEKLDRVITPTQAMKRVSLDDQIAALHKQATELASRNDWAGAVNQLIAAKPLMRKSKTIYPAQMWCRLPRYMDGAGMYDECIAELKKLLADLPRRARKDAQLDNPSVGPIETKNRFYETLLKNDAETIKNQMDKIISSRARATQKIAGHQIKKRISKKANE